MLNQTSAEALYSATYVENYLECVENLPDDLQRQMTRLRELDVSYRSCLKDVGTLLELCSAIEQTPASQARHQKYMDKIRVTLIQAQEIGDEKLQVVQNVQDLIDNRVRALDTDYKKLMTCIEVSTNGPLKDELAAADLAMRSEKDLTLTQSASLTMKVTSPTSTPPHNNEREKEKSERERSNGERGAKRARRGRGSASGGISRDVSERGVTGGGGGADNTSDEREDSQRNSASGQKKALGKKKKRKMRAYSTAQKSRDDTPTEELIDPDEPRYCLCDQISYGEMILCDNDLCPIEWFHFSCVYLTTKPKGKWFCPKCRGDRPNVMKPKGLFLKELEKYNREKEEKA